MRSNQLSLAFSWSYLNHNPTRTHAASPQHIWEDYGLEMGRLRGLVSSESTGKRNGDGQEGKHQQPPLPPLAANRTSLPPQSRIPPTDVGPHYPTTSPLL